MPPETKTPANPKVDEDDELLSILKANLRANNADPSWYDEKEAERNSKATPFPMGSPIPKPPELNPDGSEKEDEDAPAAEPVQESADPWLVVPDSVLGLLPEESDADLLEGKEPGFTGEITDSIGRKIHFVNGKRVKGAGKNSSSQDTFRARLNGEKVHVISHDSDKRLVSVKGGDGKVKVVKTDDLDFDRGKKQKQQASGSGAVYAPDPAEVNPQTGLVDKARVGVPAMSVPPPPAEIGRLPNLTPKQRKVESHYAEAYLKDPDKLAAEYLKALKKRKLGAYPNLFATDDAKLLNPDWNPTGPGHVGEPLSDKAKKGMAQFNAAVHQTANAVAKRAFVKYLDDVVSKLPEGKRSVLVTQGGCAAGKGSSLARSTQADDPHFGMLPAAEQVGAVWDAAGEQNATENEWVFDECKKRGIKPTFAYVWAEPQDTWEAEDRGVIRRATKKGRMVGPRVFADSYAQGAKNFKAFADKHPDADFIYLDNRNKSAPKLLDSFPEETLSWDADTIYRGALASLEANKDKLGPLLYNAGMSDVKIWGPPKGE